MALQPGNKAPDFTVNDQDGKPVKLSDLRGKKVVLYFYPKDMTPGCTAEACSLRDNYRLMQKQGYEVLGVSTDSEKLHRKFIEKEKLPFRLLADVDKTLHGAYGTWVEKSMYGRKYMGTARVTFVIDENGVIEEVIGKVDTKNHAAQILKSGGDKNIRATIQPGPQSTVDGPRLTNKVSPAKKAPAKKAAKTPSKTKKAVKKTLAPKKSAKKKK